MVMLRTIERPSSATRRPLACAASSTCCTRCTWLEKLATITRRGALAMTSVEHRTDASARVGVKPGTSALVESDEEQVDALFAEAREVAQVGEAAVERQLVHLEVTGVQHGAAVGVDGHGERVGDRVVDRDELEVERAELLVLALGDLQRVRLDAVLFELRLDEGEGERRSRSAGCPARSLQQVGNRADVVFVAVREHDADDVVQAVLDRREVGQDQVDAGLVLLGEQHAAVDDQDLAVDLEGRSCCGRSRRDRRSG